MKTAYILHGTCDAEEYYEMEFPSPSNAHWLPWLQQKFLRAGVLCQNLEMPNPPEPRFDEWAAVFARARLRDDSIIVAHSAGCGFILKWLSAHKDIRLQKLVMVAPWLDPSRTSGDFVQGELDTGIANRIGEMHMLASDNDPVEGIDASKDKIIQTYPNTKLHEFEGKGHFCLSDTGPTFDKLWDIISS